MRDIMRTETGRAFAAWVCRTPRRLRRRPKTTREGFQRLACAMGSLRDAAAKTGKAADAAADAARSFRRSLLSPLRFTHAPLPYGIAFIDWKKVGESLYGPESA